MSNVVQMFKSDERGNELFLLECPDVSSVAKLTRAERVEACKAYLEDRYLLHPSNRVRRKDDPSSIQRPIPMFLRIVK